MPSEEAKQDEQSKSKQVQADSSRQLFAEKVSFDLDLDLDRSRIALLPGQVDRIWKRRGISSGSKPIMPVGSTRQQKRKAKGHHKAQSISQREQF
jgi:hypothetical protein